MAGHNITLNQEEILQLLSEDRNSAFVDVRQHENAMRIAAAKGTILPLFQ